MFISTISRTPLSKLLTITMAEDVLGLVSKGTHNYNKYIKPIEMVEFFRDQVGWLKPNDVTIDDQSLISLVDSTPILNRLKGEINGMTYNPISNRWNLMDPSIPATNWCNYIIWLRKPVQ